MSNMLRAGARGGHVSLAGLRVLDDQPDHLYCLQQDLPRRVHPFAQMQLLKVNAMERNCR